MRIWFSILASGVLLTAAGMVVTATRAQSSGNVQARARQTAQAPQQQARAWDFALTSIDGKAMPMQQYNGKVVLLVNTASMCGFTPQYEGLQKLQTDYAARGFTVIGVPSGDFKSQEYDDNAKIKDFCESKFGINFPLAEKSHVVGPDALPIYRWAKDALASNNVPKWNFHKFLIGRDGRIVAGFPSAVTPESKEMQQAIKKALAS